MDMFLQIEWNKKAEASTKKPLKRGACYRNITFKAMRLI